MISGEHRVFHRVTVLCLSFRGRSILTSPLPIVLTFDLSAVYISLGGIVTKFSNFNLSGQKWDVVLESMIAPWCSKGTLSFSATLARFDIAANA